MRGMRLFVLAGCFVGMALCASAVKAGGEAISGGTIAFVGSVVESTCDVNAENTVGLIATAAVQVSPQHYACATAGVDASLAAAPQRYVVSVIQLSDSTPDRVLKYFNDYVRASQGSTANPVLVTQTYE